MNLLKYNVNDVYCFGDIHGHFESIPYYIKKHEIRDALLIFCGDIGFGFEKPNYYQQVFDKMTRTCKKYNVQIVFLRGNHDDPSYFDGKKINRKWIKAVPDYTVVQTFLMEDETQAVPMKTFLLVGGGTSIDRSYRKDQQVLLEARYARYHGIGIEQAAKEIQVHYYWENELPVFEPDKIDEITKNDIKIEYICCHSSPKFCYPINKDGVRDWCRMDSTLSETIDEERNVMTEIYNKVREDGHPLRAWFNGHFHHHVLEVIDGISFHCLDMERNGLDGVIV